MAPLRTGTARIAIQAEQESDWRLGLLTIAWHERWIRVEEDVRPFLRVAFRKDRRDRVARMRRELVGEFDRIGRRMERAGPFTEADGAPE